MILSEGCKQQNSFKDDYLKSVQVSHDKNISPLEVQDLCASVGWSRRELPLITRALNNSISVVSAWDDGLMVGLARATGDMVFNATIWDVAVRPAYQGRGIGKLLMRELLCEIDSFNIPLVTLYSDAGIDSFYKLFGFHEDANGVCGMFREKDSL